MLINQQIVVTGAVLEEVANGLGNGWGDKLRASIIQSVLPFAGMGGLIFLLDVVGVI